MSQFVLVMIGAGALAREVVEWMRESEAIDEQQNIIFASEDLGARIDGYNIIPCSEINLRLSASAYAVYVAIADSQARKRLSEQCEQWRLGSFIHPMATVTSEHPIYPGTIILPYSVVSVNTKIGRGVIINTNSSIGHDCEIGDYVTISSQVGICGRVKIGNGVFIGVGASILPGVTIGDNAIIGAGAVVLRDVRPGQTVFGVPARSIGVSS